jgi:hypothetical protein
MASRDLHAVTLRLDLVRDIMVELAAAQPPDRAEHVLPQSGIAGRSGFQTWRSTSPPTK